MKSTNKLEKSEQHDENAVLTDKEQITIEHLKKNINFFVQHQELLDALVIPHSSGGAISLIERQVAQLREQNSDLKNRLEGLITIARENDLANQRLHHLTLALLNSKSLNLLETELNTILQRDFSADTVALKLFIEPADEQSQHLFIAPDKKLARELEKLLNKRKPACGFFSNLPLDALFTGDSSTISSMAVLPLYVEKNNCFGALVIGSNNVRRFNPEMGTLFLERLADILSHIIESRLSESTP